jgi:SulP family sulfate permease
MVGLAVYALFGGSRFAIVAPTSSTATLSAAAVLSFPVGAASLHATAYVSALMALVLVAGAVLMLLAVARQGQLSAFVSRPVLPVFAFALAVSIVIRQLPDALGFAVLPGAGVDPLHVLLFGARHVQAWHPYSIAVALVAGAAVLGLRRWPKVPSSMVVIALAIVAARLLDLKSLGVEEVGAVPLPTLQFGLPDLPLRDWLQIGELAFGLVVLVFAESWGSMRSLALVHGDALDANRDLMVLGACNVASALLQGMPVGAGFSASSANASAGAGSRWAGVCALGVIAAVLAVALPALHWLPRPVLAVAVISALWHMLNPQPLFFASVERVVTDGMARVRHRDEPRTVILSLEESSDLDSTAVECLLELDLRLRGMGKGLVLTRVQEPVRELLARWNPQGVGADDRMFWSVADAAQANR